MKNLSIEQLKNLKNYWEEEGLYRTKESDLIVRVFFDGDTMEWLTWEEVGSPESKRYEIPEVYFYYDTGDEDMTFEDLCRYAKYYINTGKVATFYDI